jgi:hypothetical protein
MAAPGSKDGGARIKRGRSPNQKARSLDHKDGGAHAKRERSPAQKMAELVTKGAAPGPKKARGPNQRGAAPGPKARREKKFFYFFFFTFISPRLVFRGSGGESPLSCGHLGSAHQKTDIAEKIKKKVFLLTELLLLRIILLQFSLNRLADLK